MISEGNHYLQTKCKCCGKNFWQNSDSENIWERCWACKDHFSGESHDSYYERAGTKSDKEQRLLSDWC